MFQPSPNQNEAKYSHYKCSNKSILKKGAMKLGKHREAKKKIELNLAV